MLRRKKQSLIKRFVKRIREYYLYCKVYLAEKISTKLGHQYVAHATADKTPGMSGHWRRFKTRMQSRKHFAQAALCRYARRTGNYKRL